MSKVISEMLGQPEREVKKLINKLEHKNGYPSHDVRLLAENIQVVRAKIAELNLDPDDTTAAELYHALLIKFQEDSRKFDEHFGVSHSGYDQKMRKAADIVSKNVEMPDRWLLKPSSAKKLLNQHPPKRLMKQLNYRSVESMLKREDPAKIYLVGSVVESPVWNKAHAKLISSLDSTAFERRPLKIVAVSHKYIKFENSDLVCAYNSDCGVLGILPAWPSEKATLLSMVVSLLDRLSDFKDVKASQLAASFSPAAAWWSDMDCLIARLGSEHVSFNLKDVAHNHLLNTALGHNKLEAAQKSFWKELFKRYENQLVPDEDSLPAIVSPFTNTAPLNQPAFEYVEDV